MAKKQLPLSSKADFTGGIWAVFNAEHYIVRIWLSTMTGKEIIYVNDKAVSKRYNITSFNTLDSINHNGDHFDVEIDTESLMPYKINCSVFINGKFTGCQRIFQNSSGMFEIAKEESSKSIKRMLERYILKGKLELAEYDLESAKMHFNKALMLDTKNGEVYYFKACIASLNEEVEDAFGFLEKALSLDFKGKNRILEEGHLAYIRVLDRFEAFKTKHF